MENKIVVKQIRIPNIFEKEDLKTIFDKTGRLRGNDDVLILTKDQYRKLTDSLDEDVESLSESAAKSFAIRVATKISMLLSSNSSPEVRASCLAAIVGLYPLDAQVALRMLNHVK